MYWYDRKVYEIVEEGESLAELSRQSKIHYYSLYNTYNKVKNKLKKLLLKRNLLKRLVKALQRLKIFSLFSKH